MLINVLIKPAWLLTENYLQDRMGHQQFGLYAAIFALGYMLLPLSDFGINQFTTRFVAQNVRARSGLISMILNTKLLLAFLYSAIFITTSVLLGYPLLAVVLLGFYFVVFSLYTLIRGLYQAFQAFVTDGVASVLDKLLLMVGIWIFMPPTAADYALLTAGTGFLAFLFLFVLFKIGYCASLELKLNFSKALVRRAFPFAVMAFLAGFNERIEPVLVEQISGPYETGLYMGAYRWIGAVSMYIWTILPYFYARFAHIPKSEVGQHSQLLKTGIVFVGLPILGFGGLTYTIGEKFFFLFKHSETTEIFYMKKILFLLAIGLTLNAFFNVFSTYLTAKGYEREVNVLLFISILFHLILSYISIFYWKGIGGAISYSATLLFTSIGYVYLVYRKTELSVPWLLIIRILGISLFYCLLTLWITNWDVIWYWKGIVQLVGLCFLVLFFLGRDLYKILKGHNIAKKV